MSRFRILALLAALAALATAFAACGGSDKSSEDPQQVLDSATLEGVKSGSIDLSLGVKSEGDEGGDLDVSLSGPFQSGGKETCRSSTMTAKANGTANGEKIDFDGGLTLLPDRAFVEYEGTEYEVDPTTFGFVKSGFEQAQQQGGGRKQPGRRQRLSESGERPESRRLRRQPEQRRQRRRRRHRARPRSAATSTSAPRSTRSSS